MRRTSQLRQHLTSGKPLFVPGCYNALSARILEHVGFPALYMTGYGTSLSLLGLPDAGLATSEPLRPDPAQPPPARAPGLFADMPA